MVERSSGGRQRSGPAASDPTARTRRRFARRQWARRWLTWRYLLLAALVIGGLGFGVYALYFSSWLRVEQVQVEGTSLLSEQQVLRAAQVPTGDPLARVDLSAIEARVGNVDAVDAVEVSREWPHDVVIEILERTPIAVVDTGSGLRYVDATGAFFGSVTAEGELPLIVRGAGADNVALAEAAAVVDALDTVVAAMVAQVDVGSVDRIELRLRDGRTVRWGSAEQSAQKAEVLLALLDQDAQVYDVSVPGLPTTR